MRVRIDLADVMLVPAVERTFNLLGITERHSIVCSVTDQMEIASHTALVVCVDTVMLGDIPLYFMRERFVVTMRKHRTFHPPPGNMRVFKVVVDTILDGICFNAGEEVVLTDNRLVTSAGEVMVTSLFAKKLRLAAREYREYHVKVQDQTLSRVIGVLAETKECAMKMIPGSTAADRPEYGIIEERNYVG